MKDPTSVAVASRSFSRHPILRAELLARYDRVTFNDDGRSLAGQELIRFLRGHERTIIGMEVVDDALLTAVPDLRVVSKYGVGLDRIDQETMRRHEVKLAWSPGVNRRSVAELVIAFAICLLRDIPVANEEVRSGNWRQHVGRQLSGQTVGVVGCGYIGKEVAILLGPFGCQVLAYDVVDYPEFYAAHQTRPVGLEELLRRCDVVTLHLPLDDTTRNILTEERLRLMKPGAILINTARGGLVDEPALKALLKDGKLRGAAFDVFATEPPEDRELLSLPNFLATPHIGSSTEEAILAMGRAAIAGLESAD